MRTEKELVDIMQEALQDMFAISEPKANFRKMMKDGTAKKIGFNLEYYLPLEGQQEVLAGIIKKYKLRGLDRDVVVNSVMFGPSPSSKKPEQKPRTTKKKKNDGVCPDCYGCGVWATGDPSPMGPMDYGDGCPWKPCPTCKKPKLKQKQK